MYKREIILKVNHVEVQRKKKPQAKEKSQDQRWQRGTSEPTVYESLSTCQCILFADIVGHQ
jgi:hypothetical protein